MMPRPIPIRALLISVSLLLVTSILQAQQGLPVWTLVEEFRVGSIDGPNAFAALGAVTVSPRSGNVFVNEYNERILAFDSTGRRLRSIGRPGGGPGEFGHLQDIHWLDGMLMATDARSHRVSWFAEDGKVVESRNIESGPIAGTAMRAQPRGPLGNGFYLGLLRQEVQREELMSYDLKLVRMDGDGNDTVIAELPERTSWYPAGGGSLWLPIPMVGGAMFAQHPHGDGVLILLQEEVNKSDSPSFRLRRLASDGTLLFSRQYNYKPLSIPDGYLEEFLTLRRSGIERGGVTLREAERILREHMPRFQTPISEMLMGADGSIWLKRREEAAEAIWWWILNARGDPVGSLLLPPQLRVRYVRGDHVWAVETDELGVYYLTKYRIAR